MFRIEKRYKFYLPREEERTWCKWFPLIDEGATADNEAALKPLLDRLSRDKESVNRKMKIDEEYRIVEFTPVQYVPKEKPKKSRKKKTDGTKKG